MRPMRSSLTRKIRVLAGSLRRSSYIDRRVVAAAKMVSTEVCLVEPLESRTMLSTYYVSNSGSDSNSGTSPTAAWRTITKANSVSLQPGDSLLFQGGETFNGNLVLGSTDSGPRIVRSSYPRFPSPRRLPRTSVSTSVMRRCFAAGSRLRANRTRSIP